MAKQAARKLPCKSSLEYLAEHAAKHGVRTTVIATDHETRIEMFPMTETLHSSCVGATANPWEGRV
jgi:hypothetical protein